MDPSNRHKLFYTETFLDSFDEILLYIKKRHSIRVSNRVKEEIFRAISLIAWNPYMGSMYGDVYRKYVIEKTIIIYRIDEKNKVVFLVEAFDARQNWTSLL